MDADALPGEFVQAAQEVAGLCRREPHDRIVCTRHGDAMLLADFLLTRIVEVAVHGRDLADALEKEPWLTTPGPDSRGR